MIREREPRKALCVELGEEEARAIQLHKVCALPVPPGERVEQFMPIELKTPDRGILIGTVVNVTRTESGGEIAIVEVGAQTGN
jgi:hypothetical protein